ncbi:hypothetical protein PM082_004580 [Marasmius tenuissimus]|nr:hypothetical protein PM082_004580 [Marasmius tenuissimus]
MLSTIRGFHIAFRGRAGLDTMVLDWMVAVARARGSCDAPDLTLISARTWDL